MRNLMRQNSNVCLHFLFWLTIASTSLFGFVAADVVINESECHTHQDGGCSHCHDPCDTGDVFFQWNCLALEANVMDHNGEASGAEPSLTQGPPLSARALAMIHIAMFDAYNVVRGGGRYETYLPDLRENIRGQGASVDAAVAKAAHTVMTRLYATNDLILEMIDGALERTLNGIRSTRGRRRGERVGRQVGEACMKDRENDGYDESNPYLMSVEYTPHGTPGDHVVDPNNPFQGFLSPGAGYMPPFGMDSISAFRSLTPPGLLESTRDEEVPELSRLRLINVATGEVVVDNITNGVVIDVSALGMTGPNFSIEAAVAPFSTPIGSVKFAWNGNDNFQTENAAVYALCGDKGGNYNPCPDLDYGSHTVSATPFAGDGGSGEMGATVTVSFTIVPSGRALRQPVSAAVAPSPTPSTGITGFKLIYAPTNEEVFDLTNNAVVSLQTLGLPSADFNIKAQNVGTSVKSVQFKPNGQNESFQPFAFCGDNGGNYKTCDELAVGTMHTISVTPFTGPSQSGMALPDVSVTFSIVDAAPPMAPPAPAPVPTIEFDENNEEYMAALMEVMEKGIFRGGTASDPIPQGDAGYDIANYWSYNGSPCTGTPPRMYNMIARDISKQMENSLDDNALLFTMINVALGNAGISSWDSKYLYRYWRPVVGIRHYMGTSEWSPLGASRSNPYPGETNFSPPFPAYNSGHATFGAAAFKILMNFYQTADFPFTFVSDEWNDRTRDQFNRVRPLRPRTFASLRDAMAENAASRVFNGVHWRYDGTAGVAAGCEIADYVFTTIFLPENPAKRAERIAIPDGDVFGMIDCILEHPDYQETGDCAV